MKVYRGFDKEVGPISYAHWTYVTPDIEQAKWYATKDGDVKNGAIIEWDLDIDNLRFISLDKLNSFAQSKSEIYSEKDLLWYQEGLGESLYKYISGIYFTDPYYKNHIIYIVFRKDDLKNGRILSSKEFNRVQLKETIIDAKSVGDDLMNIILKNPTRKELAQNNMNYSRGALGKDGNFYFISLSDIIHSQMIDTLTNLGINEKPYFLFKYDNKMNTIFFYNDDIYDDDTLNEYIKILKSSPNFINYNNCSFELIDDPEFDPELYESTNNSIIKHKNINESSNNNLITLYRGFDTRYGNFGSPNSFIWATDDIDIAKMYVDKNETSALLKFQLDPNKLNEISEWNSDFQDFINEYGIFDGIDFDEDCAQWCRSKGYNCFIHGSDNEYWIILDSNLILNPEIIK